MCVSFMGWIFVENSEKCVKLFVLTQIQQLSIFNIPIQKMHGDIQVLIIQSLILFPFSFFFSFKTLKLLTHTHTHTHPNSQLIFFNSPHKNLKYVCVCVSVCVQTLPHTHTYITHVIKFLNNPPFNNILDKFFNLSYFLPFFSLPIQSPSKSNP